MDTHHRLIFKGPFLYEHMVRVPLMIRLPESFHPVTQYYSKQKWVNPIRMIRTGDFKLNRHLHRGDELYDLKNDPDELRNLAGDPAYAEVITDLGTKLDQWMQDHDDPFFTQSITDRQGNPLNPHE